MFKYHGGSYNYSEKCKNLCLQKIDITNFSKITGRITPAFSWKNQDEFIRNEFGYCIISNDEVVACAFSAAVCDEYVDIGVETVEEARGKSYGNIVAGAMLEAVVNSNREPVRACDTGHEASMKLACPPGFEVVGTHKYYKIS